mgnify:FL=1
MGGNDIETRQIDTFLWEVPKSGKMRVPTRVYADSQLLGAIISDNCIQQAVNVTHLPGIVGASLAMPDAHWGYGFPIGGVAATDPQKQGVISPGGIGFDINCGVRMLRTDLRADQVDAKADALANALYSEVPCGVGSSEAIKSLSDSEMRRVLTDGARWAVEQGFGREDDLIRTEEEGALDGASADVVSKRAMDRGRSQLGTLGSGNHFLELDVVDEIFAPEVADVFGVEKGLVVVQIHCGSRGFGHQVCSDFLKVMKKASRKYDIDLPDRQLCCAPVNSPEGKEYFAAMAAGANYAWCNRQVILALVERALGRVFDGDRDSFGMRQIYDVCHNIAKFEEHDVDGRKRTLCVHRKGATRAFPPHHPDTPKPYQEVGQPVLIPGDMGTASYLLVGTQGAMEKTWGSTCHGAGRVMSRKGAVRQTKGRNIFKELKQKGITVRARSKKTVSEEMPGAYKDVESVVRVMDEAGITRKVARLKPIAVVKG